MKLTLFHLPRLSHFFFFFFWSPETCKQIGNKISATQFYHYLNSCDCPFKKYVLVQTGHFLLEAHVCIHLLCIQEERKLIFTWIYTYLSKYYIHYFYNSNSILTIFYWFLVMINFFETFSPTYHYHLAQYLQHIINDQDTLLPNILQNMLCL